MSQEIAFLLSLRRDGLKPGTTRIGKILRNFKNPHQHIPTVHIAGTNGKGSTAAFLSSILYHQGYKVGLYTSPHLESVHERIRINGQPIDDQQLTHHIQTIRNNMPNSFPYTFFELITACAFKHFEQQKVDIAIIETGVGGLMDATNIIHPRLSIITSIGLDHTNRLGNTISKISHHKAGIIKRKTPVICAQHPPEAQSVIRKKAYWLGSPLYRIGEEIQIRSVWKGLQGSEITLDKGISGTYTISMLGQHQAENAALAITAAHILNQQGMNIHHNAVRNGIHQAQWPGRLEKRSTHPLFLIDGAHNAHAIQAISAFLSRITGVDNQYNTLVFSCLEGKKPRELLAPLAPFFSECILTQTPHKSMPLEQLYTASLGLFKRVTTISHPHKAVQQALYQSRRDSLILATGSMYLIGSLNKQ